MSSHSEFKSDVKSVVGGAVLVIIATLTFQLAFLIAAAVLILLAIAFYRAFGGKNKQVESEIKAGIIVLLGILCIIYVCVGWYNHVYKPLYPTRTPEQQQYWDNKYTPEGKAQQKQEYEEWSKQYDANRNRYLNSQ